MSKRERWYFGRRGKMSYRDTEDQSGRPTPTRSRISSSSWARTESGASTSTWCSGRWRRAVLGSNLNKLVRGLAAQNEMVLVG